MRTQISILSPEFARAPNWGSHVLPTCISSLCKPTLDRIRVYKYGRQKTYITSHAKAAEHFLRTFNVLYLCTYLLLDVCLGKEVDVGPRTWRERSWGILPQIVCVAMSICRNGYMVYLEIFFLALSWCHDTDWRSSCNVRRSQLMYDRFHLMRQSFLLHSKLPPVLCILLDHSILGLFVVRLYHFEVGHIPVHLWQSLQRLYIGWEDHTNHCTSSV